MDDDLEPKDEDSKPEKPRSSWMIERPGWIPDWMGEYERAAFILAVGIVLGAGMIAFAILAGFDNIKHRL